MHLFFLYEVYGILEWLEDFPEDKLEILETVKEEYDIYGDSYWFWFYLQNAILWFPEFLCFFLNEGNDE